MLDFLKSKLDNVELAYQLFNSLNLGSSCDDIRYQKEINRIYKINSDRQFILNKVIELVGTTNTPKQRYILAMAYAYSRVAYRKQAIKYINLYLNNNIWEEYYQHIGHSLYGKRFSIEQEHDIHISGMLNYLGKAYEGEHDFDNALKAYFKEKQLIPFWPHPYCNIVRAFTKQNRLDDALLILKEAQKSQYYKKTLYTSNVLEKSYIDDTFMKVIDNEIIDIKNKIKKGYIYKSRKKADNVSCFAD